jgi:ribosome-binding protein aMBF1 (putative translation factor)
MAKPKYATLEEASAARSAASKAHWADPAFCARMLPVVRAGAKLAAAGRRKITSDQLAQLLTDYAEKAPTGPRRYRWSGKELARRYGISCNYVFDLAQINGLQRYNRGRKVKVVDPAIVEIAA